MAFAFLTASIWHHTGAESWEFGIIRTARRHPLWGATEWRSLFEPVPFGLILIAIVGMAISDRRPKLAAAGFAGCLLAVSLAGLLKPIVERRQQYHWSPWFPNQYQGFLTYPSGHVAGSAACATFAWFVLSRHTRLAALAFVVPVAVAWAMIALRSHYPADAIASFLLAPVIVAGTVLGTYKVFGRDVVRATDARPSAQGPSGSN